MLERERKSDIYIQSYLQVTHPGVGGGTHRRCTTSNNGRLVEPGKRRLQKERERGPNSESLRYSEKKRNGKWE